MKPNRHDKRARKRFKREFRTELERIEADRFNVVPQDMFRKWHDRASLAEARPRSPTRGRFISWSDVRRGGGKP